MNLIPVAWLVYHDQMKVAIAYDWKPEYETAPFRLEPLYDRETLDAAVAEAVKHESKHK